MSNAVSHTVAAAWSTSDYPPDYPAAPLSAWKRAEKRVPDVTLGPGFFSVVGRPGLGDEYPEYRIQEVQHGYRRLICSCKTHMGGEARGAYCTHRMAVALWCHRHGRSPAHFLSWTWPEESPVSSQAQAPITEGGAAYEVAQNWPSAGTIPPVPVEDPIPAQALHMAPVAEIGWREAAQILPPEPQHQRPRTMLHQQAPWCRDVTSEHYADYLRVCLAHYRHENHADAWAGVAPWDVPCIPHVSRWKFAPPWLKEVRPNQWLAIQQAVRNFVERGVPYIFADMPTGSGKTVVGVLIWEEIRSLEIPLQHQPSCVKEDCQGCWEPIKALYLCTTKQLQDQAAEDFPDAVVLKGKANYPTANYPELFEVDPNAWASDRVTCGDCVWDSTHCFLCDAMDFGNPVPWTAKDRCPYTLNLKRAMRAELVITNPAYALPVWNNMGTFSGRFVIWDEGDTAEESIASYVSVELPPRLQDQLGIQPPDLKTVLSAWERWFDGFDSRSHTSMNAALAVSGQLVGQVDPVLGLAVRAGSATLQRFGVESLINKRLEAISQQLLGLEKTGKGAMKLRREMKRLDDLVQKLKGVREQLNSNWVYTGYEDANKGRSSNGDPDPSHSIEFKPIKVHELAPKYALEHGRFILFESGTMIAPTAMAADLGLQPMDFAQIAIPSPFPVANRPIYYQPIAANTGSSRAEKLKAWHPISERCLELIAYHLSQRHNMLIHTVTYDFTRYLEDRLHAAGFGGVTITYSGADQRIRALERYCKHGGVLLAPSMERGVNLKDDLCRAQIICKIPFPYLGDKVISMRTNATGPSGKTWYARQTVQALCQMYGRPNRSETDWSYTYILDKAFEGFYSKNRQLFPVYFSEAVIGMPMLNSGRRK